VAEAAPVDGILTYCHYNLLNTTMDAVLTGFAREHGMGLINASGLCMGLLTEQGPRDWHPASQTVKDAGKKAAEFCGQRGANIADLATRFCLDHPYVSSTLIGIATRQEVEASLRLLETANDQAVLAQVESILAPTFNCEWPSGRPENQG
jgi:L-galactose dehydrogenase